MEICEELDDGWLRERVVWDFHIRFPVRMFGSAL